jgi:hypothetical protein
MDEPLSPPAAKKLIGTILVSGTLEFTGHALEEMDNDDLQEVDVRNTLKGGVPLPAEFEKGSWTYRFHSQRLGAVIRFLSEIRARVITAYRIKKKKK